MNIRTLLVAIAMAFLCVTQAAHAEEDVSVSDLPLEELKSQGKSKLLAVFYSGDGGWASLDKGVSGQLAAAGVKVVGMNSLRYFWTQRNPDEAAADLSRVLRYYLSEMDPSARVILVGYSTGADVMPFMVNRLPDLLRARIASVALIAPGKDAQFVIRVRDWLPGKGSSGTPLMPELEHLGVPLLCLYGEGDKYAICPELPASLATSALIGDGHHLGGDYDAVAQRILSFTQDH